jgi:N-acetylneuraminic acid mutarotase
VPVSVRALIAHFCCPGIACLLWAGAPLAFCSPEAPRRPPSTTLTFAERAAYQRAIEEVRWCHRIWPKENPRPKPPLQAIISAREIEQKVEDYLRKSQSVADQRRQPISAGELQAEMDRMAKHTKQAEVLRELFATLGNDPFVIAECLARPVLAERLATSAHLTGGDRWNRGEPERRYRVLNAIAVASASYTLPQILEGAGGCTDDTWTATTTVNAPDARYHHTAVWTGSEMIIWGGLGQVTVLNTGGKYDPAEDAWMPTSTVNAPTARVFHAAVWTGSEIIVWGGQAPSLLNTGGRYNPATDSWTATSTFNAPTARIFHSGVWTGRQMIVWGGANGVGWFNTGGRYDPNTDSWTATSTINAPEARYGHTAEWTGSEMIVWGGTNQTNYLHTGGRYDPASDTWTPTSLVGVPLGRVAHTSIWTGSEMIVWGGADETFNDTNTGGRYNATDDSWMATNVGNAPSPRVGHSAVWTGSEMIIWGGGFCCPPIDFDTGGRYSPSTDSWISTSAANAPFARFDHSAVWAGSEMVVWGGYNDVVDVVLNTGGRYCAQSGGTPTPTPTPTATATPTATPTPSPTPRATPTPRIAPTPRARPTPPPRP